MREWQEIQRVYEDVDFMRRRLEEAEERYELFMAVGLLQWRDTVLYRPHPELKPQRVLDVFAEEKSKLLPLPEHRFEAELLKPIRSIDHIPDTAEGTRIHFLGR